MAFQVRGRRRAVDHDQAVVPASGNADRFRDPDYFGGPSALFSRGRVIGTVGPVAPGVDLAVDPDGLAVVLAGADVFGVFGERNFFRRGLARLRFFRAACRGRFVAELAGAVAAPGVDNTRVADAY